MACAASQQEKTIMTRWIDETLHPHFRCLLKADRVLYENKTEHQHLVIFELSLIHI